MSLNARDRKWRWEEFKEEFDDYAIFTDHSLKENAEKQMRAFSLHLGPHWRGKLKTLTLEPLPLTVPDKLCPLLIVTVKALGENSVDLKTFWF